MAKEARIAGARINSVGLGLAGGILLAVCMFVMTAVGIIFPNFSTTLNSFVSFYGFLGKIGYDISVLGMFLGAIYGFIEGFLFFWILGLLYNRLR